MHSRSAITFVELLVVIIIIGILAGVAIPNLRKTYDNFVLDNFVKDIYYLCQFLQSSAISQVKTHLLKIDQDNSPPQFNAFYQVEDENEEKSYQAAEGRFGKTYLVPEGIILTSEETGVYFYPDGSVTPATIIFNNAYEHKLSLIIKGASGGIKIE